MSVVSGFSRTSAERRTLRPMEQPARDVRPEFLPHIPDGAPDKSARAPPRRLPPRRLAGRQPGVFNEVVDRVSRVASPRRREMTVRTIREEDGFHRVTEARLDAMLV